MKIRIVNLFDDILQIIKIRLSLSVLFAVIISVFIVIILSGYWKKPHKVISADVQEYYSYLPATFIFHDLTTTSIPFDYKKEYLWSYKSPIGIPVFKFTMGLSFLYTPFFFIAYLYSIVSGQYSLGVGAPYQFALLMSSFAFFILGMVYLRKILLKYYSDSVTAITILSVVIGTNMFYYAGVRAAMSHVFSFALFTVFVWNTIKWYNVHTVKTSIVLGLLAGLISLIRPSNAIIIIFFVFYGLTGRRALLLRFSLFLKQYKLILLIIFFAFLVWIPQIFYWKIMTGSFFYYSYGSKEGFFFTNPQIINILFSYHNGWLLYTPIMIFALLGIALLYYKRKGLFWSVFLYTVLNIYVLSSWWCWWFVGFGNRAFIESYAILAFPFAEFTCFIIYHRKKILQYVFYPILLFLLFLNCFQTWQYANNLGHYDGMTKKAYWYLFLNKNPHRNYYKYMARPDYKKAKKGIYEFNKKKSF